LLERIADSNEPKSFQYKKAQNLLKNLSQSLIHSLFIPNRLCLCISFAFLVSYSASKSISYYTKSPYPINKNYFIACRCFFNLYFSTSTLTILSFVIVDAYCIHYLKTSKLFLSMTFKSHGDRFNFHSALLHALCKKFTLLPMLKIICASDLSMIFGICLISKEYLAFHISFSFVYSRTKNSPNGSCNSPLYTH